MLDRDPSLNCAVLERRTIIETEIEDGFIEIPWGSLGGTALHYAIKSGMLGMVEVLLDRGVDVNACTQPAKWTPLHDATYYGIMRDHRDAKAIICLLVRAGANLSAVTWGEYRPLDIASHLSFVESSADIFDMLLSLAQST